MRNSVMVMVLLAGGTACDAVAEAAEDASPATAVSYPLDPGAPRYTVFDENQELSVRQLADGTRWARGLRAEIRGTIGRRWTRGFLLRGPKDRSVLVVTRDGLAPSWLRVRGTPVVEVHGRLALAPRSFMHRLHGISSETLDELVDEHGDVPHVRASEVIAR